MVSPAPSFIRIPDLIRRTLEQGFGETGQAIVADIVRRYQTPTMQRAFDEFNDYATEAQSNNLPFDINHSSFRALMAEFSLALQDNVAVLNNGQEAVLVSGYETANDLTRKLALGEITDKQMQSVMGRVWNRPSPATIDYARQILTSDDWRNKLSDFPNAMRVQAQSIALRGITEGWSPTRTAGEITKSMQTLPAHAANQMVRTLQMHSYRTGQMINMQENSDILESHIRIAALDDRTCMACIALHGTELKLSERVDDHHQGRCTSIPIVKGRSRDIQTGPEWFESLPEERQLKIAGPGKLEALKSGKIKWENMATSYSDPAYGRMIKEAALKDLIEQGRTVASVPSNPLTKTSSGLPVTRQVNDDSFYESLKTSNDVKKYLKDKYNVNMSIARETTVEGLRSLAKEFDALAADYPHIADKLETLSVIRSNAARGWWGRAYGDGKTLELNARAVNSLVNDRVPEYGKWDMQDTNLNNETLTHEWGHLVHFYMEQSRQSPLPFRLVSLNDVDSWVTRGSAGLHDRATRENLSEYGTHDLYETFAELFVSHRYMPENKKNDLTRQYESMLYSLNAHNPNAWYSSSDSPMLLSSNLTQEQRTQYNDMLEAIGRGK